jgi:CheY-like chemotaxis protein
MSTYKVLPISVLLVDDNLTTLRALRDELDSRPKYEALCSTGYAHAISRIEKSDHLDVIVIDAQLKGERSGLDLAWHAINAFADIGVVIIAYGGARGVCPQRTVHLQRQFNGIEMRECVTRAMKHARSPVMALVAADMLADDPRLSTEHCHSGS